MVSPEKPQTKASRPELVVGGARVPRAEFACGRVGDDGDGMSAQPVRPALRLLSGSTACMTASCCIFMAWGVVPPRTSVVVLAPRVMAHIPVGARGRSCEAETCRARWRLLGRDPSCGKLVEDAANWSET
jgi:hypothetical protein